MDQRKKMLRYSQQLRKNQTKEENHLWYDFLKTYPVQFRRQYPIGQYIADFYCHKARLIVELDGSQHCDPEGAAYDARRTAALEANGLRVLRFSNLDVMRNFRGVCEAIDLTVKSRLSASFTDESHI